MTVSFNSVKELHKSEDIEAHETRIFIPKVLTERVRSTYLPLLDEIFLSSRSKLRSTLNCASVASRF